jgi:hypothetical protein
VWTTPPLSRMFTGASRSARCEKIISVFCVF